MDVARITSRVVAGAAAGDLAVLGIHPYDELIVVQDLTNGVSDLKAEFAVTADDTINNLGGTSTAGHQVFVQWYRNFRTRSQTGETSAPIGRSPF